MAKATNFVFEIPLTPKQTDYLASLAPGDDTPANKVRLVILSTVEHQAEGGLMLTRQFLDRLTSSTGIDPENEEEFLAALEKSSGRAAGCLVVQVSIDPAFEPAIQEIATLRGVDVASIVNDTVTACLEQNWYESLPYQPRHLLMTETDHAALEYLLGEKFSTGTDLAKLIRKTLGDSGGFDIGSIGDEAAEQHPETVL